MAAPSKYRIQQDINKQWQVVDRGDGRLVATVNSRREARELREKMLRDKSQPYETKEASGGQ